MQKSIAISDEALVCWDRDVAPHLPSIPEDVLITRGAMYDLPSVILVIPFPSVVGLKKSKSRAIAVWHSHGNPWLDHWIVRGWEQITQPPTSDVFHCFGDWYVEYDFGVRVYQTLAGCSLCPQRRV